MGHNRKPRRGDSYSYNITVVFQGALVTVGFIAKEYAPLFILCPRSLDHFHIVSREN